MNQVLQHLGTGALTSRQVPCPQPGRHQLLIESRASLISPGTERMLVEFGRAGWVRKARQQPERVRQTLDKIRADGLRAAVEAVRAKLDREIPMGYANAGVVARCGADAAGWRPGDRVVSNGAHAEMVAVPAMLCAPVPAAVSDEEAPFAVLAAIALQGIRLMEPSLGERFAVTGLGLVGLLAAQLLRQAGCRVLGLDFNPARLALAERWGIETHQLTADADQTLARAARFAGGHGVDGVLIAAATSSDEPVRQAAAMCRQRGRIVLTGVAGLTLSRDLFYKKELSFQVSCSYGPGRYDDAYENRGQDYPRAHARWTAQRNFEAALDLMAQGRLEVQPLISHRFAFAEAERAYELISSGQPSLGVVLSYGHAADGQAAGSSAGTAGSNPKLDTRIILTRPAADGRGSRSASAGVPVVGLIGAGEYAAKVLLPELAGAGAVLDTVVSVTGLGAAWAGSRYGFGQVASDEEAVLGNPRVDTVVIATRHDSHARLAAEALRRGKSVWVEKPLAIDQAGLDLVTEAWMASASPRLMVGFNRRFAPLTAQLRRRLPAGPKQFRYTVNAGGAAEGHWTLDRAQGGGRIVGEACHFLDLLRALAGAPIARLEARPEPGPQAGPRGRAVAGAHLWIEFEDGSTGVVDYLTGGAKSFPKERLEVFGGGRVLVLDNFRRLESHPSPAWSGWRWPGGRQQKGQREAVRAFLGAVRNGAPSPVRFDELEEVSRWAILAAAQLGQTS